MGLILINKGIGPTEEKVKGVVRAREPQNASKVRSFLGLANYKARFIPDFATVGETLCKLTKKGVRFRFGDEQRRAFNELKSRLSSVETLGYFDKCFGCQLVSSKQSCSPRANQVNSLTTRSMGRLGPGFIGSFTIM